jgi:uncharacterized protein YneF (UPF0154 family)
MLLLLYVVVVVLVVVAAVFIVVVFLNIVQTTLNLREHPVLVLDSCPSMHEHSKSLFILQDPLL